MKKVKLLALFVAMAMLSSLSVFATDVIVGKTDPVLDGVISEGEYDPQSVYVLDKATVAKYNGCWTGEMTDEMGVTFHFAWSDKGLYMAAEVKDPTYAPATTWDVHGADGGPAADGLQLNLFSHDEAKWFTLGAYADGKLAARTHFGDVTNMEGIVTGKAVRDAAAKTYVYECLIPWTALQSDKTFAEGLKIPYLMTYMDRIAEGGETCYKTMDAAEWPPLDTIDNYLVLSAAYVAPAPTTEAPVAEDVPAPAPDAGAAPVTPAPTSDSAILFAILLVLASTVGVVVFKKQSVK